MDYDEGDEEDEKTIKFPFFSISLRLRTTFGLWPLSASSSV